MKRWMVAVTWFALLLVGNAHESLASDLDLAHKCSPILILTKDTEGEYSVLKPEPVEIVGADSSSNLWFEVFRLGGDNAGDYQTTHTTYTDSTTVIPYFYKLIMGDLSHSLVPRDSTQAEGIEPDLAVGEGRSARTGRFANLGTGERIVLKFSTETLAAYCSIHVGAQFTQDEPGELSGVSGAILGAAVGYLGAVPAGVTLWDPYDDPDRLVLASFLGGLGSLVLPSTWRPWGIYVSSPALATIASEWSRQPPKDTPAHRISVSLMPGSQGHLLVVTTVRF